MLFQVQKGLNQNPSTSGLILRNATAKYGLNKSVKAIVNSRNGHS